MALACVLAAWLVARPASASAPLCDERGASALAPAPVLDTPGGSVDVGERPDGRGLWVGKDVTYQRGERPLRILRSVRADVAPVTHALVVPPCAPDTTVMSESGVRPSSGVRFALERPPRSAARA